MQHQFFKQIKTKHATKIVFQQMSLQTPLKYYINYHVTTVVYFLLYTMNNNYADQIKIPIHVQNLLTTIMVYLTQCSSEISIASFTIPCFQLLQLQWYLPLINNKNNTPYINIRIGAKIVRGTKFSLSK